MKNLYREGCLIIKHDDVLDEVWQEKLSKIMEVIKLPLFVRFIDKGYISVFKDGIDLQMDKPFDHRHDRVRAYPLNKIQREGVIKIFKDIVYAGIKTGYTLADFTRRNIILVDDTPYLIDFDVIIEGELNMDYINIFQKMLDYLEIKYRFDGDLKKLYEKL